MAKSWKGTESIKLVTNIEQASTENRKSHCSGGASYGLRLKLPTPNVGQTPAPLHPLFLSNIRSVSNLKTIRLIVLNALSKSNLTFLIHTKTSMRFFS